MAAVVYESLLESTTHLKEGKVGVLPTDTIYGICASARNKESVERVYALRGRDTDKPCIILVHSREALAEFALEVDSAIESLLSRVWPGPVSVVFECSGEQLHYLHRGTNTLCFRVPANENLRELLKQTGPLIAPSANTQGEPPAATCEEARRYFGDSVDFYVDGGEQKSEPSTVIELTPDGYQVLRKGKGDV